MPRIERKWKLSLVLINLTVLFVVLLVAMMNHVSGGKEVLRMLVYALIFANTAGIPAVALLPPVLDRVVQHKWPIVPLLVPSFALFTAAGCLLAQGLLLLLHRTSPETFWHDYYFNVRFGVLFSVVFGSGAFFYGSLRERLRDTENKLHEKEVAEERMRKLEAEARLRWLESRIHPHFLFNTLNSISSLIPADPVRAEQIVGRLAALLRASLDSSNQPLIPLEREMAIVEDYVDIEKARFGNKLRSEITIPSDLHEAKVPPLAVQSLVENAVKYGITPQKGGGELRVSAFSQNGSLHVEVSDSGPGFDLAAIPADHGLDNLVGRLDALFGSDARLNVTRRDGRCVVEMVLPRS
jgi:two-component system, LytTR family, sensor histidine kinase AlgZ